MLRWLLGADLAVIGKSSTGSYNKRTQLHELIGQGFDGKAKVVLIGKLDSWYLRHRNLNARRSEVNHFDSHHSVLVIEEMILHRTYMRSRGKMREQTKLDR